MANAASTIEQWIGTALEQWDPRPEAAMVFGAFARRDGDADSDIDVLLVRPDAVDADQHAWLTQRQTLIEDLEQKSGNRVQIVELSATELAESVATRQPLVESLQRGKVPFRLRYSSMGLTMSR